MKDNPDTNVHFVKMIESNPCVYNRKCRQFSNKQKQDETWAMIGKKFDATGNSFAPSACHNLESNDKEDFTDINLSDDEQHNNESTVIDGVNNPNVQDSSDTNFTKIDPRLLATPVSTQPMVSAKRSWVDFDDANEAVVKFLTKQRSKEMQRHDDEDLDLCFFKSLLPDIRQMNPDQKRRFKVGIINLSGTILDEEVPPLSLSDYNNIKREYENIERLNGESPQSFNLLTQKSTKPPLETNKSSFPRSTLVSGISTQNNVFPHLISKQSTQCMPHQEKVPSTNNHGNLEYHNTESRPSSAHSTLSFESSIVEYKVSTEDFE